MKRRTTQNNRPAKNDVITISDDDDTPAIKSEPVSSPEVVQLQQKVAALEEALAKSESIKQGACRVAGEAQARVKFLEELIDSKPQVVERAHPVSSEDRETELKKEISDLKAQLEVTKEGLEKKVEDMASQLEAKKYREEDLTRRVHELTTQLEEERSATKAREDDLMKKVADATNQWEEDRMSHCAMTEQREALEKKVNDLTTQLVVKKEREDELEKKVTNVTNQLEEKNVELEKKLADVTSKLETARNEVESANGKNAELQQQMEALTLEKTTMISQLTGENAALKQQITEMKRLVESLYPFLEALKAGPPIAKLETSNSTASDASSLSLAYEDTKKDEMEE